VLKTFRESLSLLATRRFGTFWFASLLSSIGTWAQQVAEPWLLLTLGASPFLIGLDSFAMSAPVWLLTLVGGVLADRSDRRRVITLFQSIQMLCPSAIVALLVTHMIQPWMIIVLSVVVGITDALSMPSFQSIVPSIVTREQIGRGLALNSTQFNLSRILGPAIAGVLMSSVGAMTCFVASAASYVPFIGVALWILPRWAPGPSRAGAPPQRRLSAAIADILHQPQLRRRRRPPGYKARAPPQRTGGLDSPSGTSPDVASDAPARSTRGVTPGATAFGVGDMAQRVPARTNPRANRAHPAGRNASLMDRRTWYAA
jgi:MFS family permease